MGFAIGPRWPRLASVVACGAICLFGCSMQSPSKSVPGPVFVSTRQDLGSVRQEHEYTAVYRYVNSGETPLSITGIRASCGCVASEFDERSVEPGASQEISLTLSTHGRRTQG